MKKILIVDDDIPVRKVLAMMVPMLGDYNVKTADGFLTGYSSFEEEQKQGGIDILITDLSMPDGSGIDLIKKIRTNYPNTSPYSICLTGFLSILPKTEKEDKNFKQILTKPIKMSEMEKALKTAENYLDSKY